MLGTYQVVSPHEKTPEAVWSSIYTHVYQLPYPAKDLFGLSMLMFGQSNQPAYMTLQGDWFLSPNLRPETQQGQAPGQGASSLMLPIRAKNGDHGYLNGSVALVGGQEGTSHEHSLDIFDPVLGTWKRIDMEVGRHHPSSLLLPDGRMLVLGGCSCFGDADPRIGKTQYIDPKNNFAMTWGSAAMDEFRGYHTLAILLPDGRVLIGGGNPETEAGWELANFRYYYPPYFYTPRPTLLNPPKILKLGQNFNVQWAGQKQVIDLVLIGLPSMTHSVDMNQKYVQLPVYTSVPSSATSGTLSAGIPNSPETLSPGYYMLFALDQNRIPSVAATVKIER